MNRNRIRIPLLLITFVGSFISYAQQTSPPPATPAGQPGDTIHLAGHPTTPYYNLLFQPRSKKLYTGAVGEVYIADIQKTVSSSYSGLLAGRLAGLFTIQYSGEPGNDDVSLFVRGQAPLVMVDGTPQSFVSIDPEQIESITVCKDALSAAMMGQRSSGGLILVTTKKGQEGAQRVEFNASYGVQQPTKTPKFLHAYDYARLYNEALVNEGQQPVYTQADLDAYKNNTDPIGHPDIDWQKQILKNQAPFSRYDLSVSGGRKTARYFVNLDYLHQDGLFKKESFNVYNTNADYKRYIFRSNVEVDLSRYFTTSLNLFGRVQNSNQPGVTNGTIFNNLLNTPNNAYPVKNADGSLGGNLDYQSNLYGQSVLSGYQPIYERDFKVDVVLKGNLDFLAKGLWIKGLAAINAYQRETINRSKTFAVFKQNTDAAGNITYGQYGTKGDQNNSIAVNTQNRLFYNELSVGYSKSFGAHSINAVALVNNDYRMQNSDLPMNFSGVSAKLSYDYKQKYLLDAAVGYNGNERYPAGNRYGIFPAAGLGWNITEEDFLKNRVSWLNAVKLRASFGKTGYANIGYYEYYQYYVPGNGYGFGSTVPSSTATLQQGSLANPNISWEKADKFSAGVDASLFNNRLSLTVDYFNDKYYDLVQQRSNGSAILGTDYMRENIGQNRYTGFELQASWQVAKGAFNYFIAPNISLLKSKVLYQAEPARAYDWMMRTGRPVGQPFGYVAEGLFSSAADIAAHASQGSGIQPGDIKYKDLNNDGKIDASDQTAIGNAKPFIYYGFNTGAGYKGFDINILIQGAAHRSVPLAGNSFWAFQNGGKGQAWEAQLNRWTPQNTENATYPRLWLGNNANNTAASSYWVRSGDYLRLKTVELGYSLPASLISKAKLTQLRLFVNATNLLTITPLGDIDPENPYWAYPIMRTINGGLSLKF